MGKNLSRDHEVLHIIACFLVAFNLVRFVASSGKCFLYT